MGISHFAKLNDSNVVTEVLVLDDANTGGPDDTEDNTGQNFLRKRLLEPTAVWKRADINTFRNTHSSGDNSKAFRGNYPGKNYTYDEAKNVFIPPKTFGLERFSAGYSITGQIRPRSRFEFDRN